MLTHHLSSASERRDYYFLFLSKANGTTKNIKALGQQGSFSGVCACGEGMETAELFGLGVGVVSVGVGCTGVGVGDGDGLGCGG